MRKRSKRWLLFGCFMLSVLFGLTMLDPFFRQLIFGPTYNGIPLITWQELLRGSERGEQSVLDNIRDAITGRPDAGNWRKLPGEDRRAILLTLTQDPNEHVRWQVAHHLGDVPGSPEVLAALQ